MPEESDLSSRELPGRDVQNYGIKVYRSVIDTTSIEDLQSSLVEQYGKLVTPLEIPDFNLVSRRETARVMLSPEVVGKAGSGLVAAALREELPARAHKPHTSYAGRVLLTFSKHGRRHIVLPLGHDNVHATRRAQATAIIDRVTGINTAWREPDWLLPIATLHGNDALEDIRRLRLHPKIAVQFGGIMVDRRKSKNR